MSSSRRNFLQTTALGIAGSVSLPFLGKSALVERGADKQSAAFPLVVGVAGYTFAKFDLDQSITMMKRIGIKNLSVKEIHLPLNSSDEKIKTAMGKFSEAGINVYTVGVIYLKTK